MGISIEQYRARIGTFAARKCSRSEETRPVVFDQNTENSETLQPVLCSISWKTTSLGILLVILSALCHSQLLIIGGVESHPGPESVDDVLAALCVGAPDTSIRDCIRLYRKEATTVQHKKAFAKCDKSTLLETMEYLNVSGQDEYTKESVINKFIVRIQNLLPDTCRMCKAEYCTKLKEVTILSCSLCGQAAHNDCIAQKMGMDREQLEDLRKEEAQIRINPLEIPGCHYLCGPCEESVIPSTEAGKLKRRKHTLTTDSQSDIVFQETQEGTDHVSQSQETNDESNPTASQIDSTESSSHHEDELSTVDPPTNQLPTRGEPGGNSRTQAPEQSQNKSQGICSFFRKGTCRYGISGRGCPKQHPKAYRKLVLHGTRGPRGCNKGNACENFHPKCADNLKLLVNVFHKSTPEKMMETFLSVCLEIVKEVIPLKRQSNGTKSRKAHRIPRHRRNLMRTRQNIQLASCHSDSRRNALNKRLIEIEKQLQASHKAQSEAEEKKAVERISSNSKYFYSYAKRFSNIKVGIGPLLDAANTLVSCPKRISEMLSEQYSSVFSRPKCDISDINNLFEDEVPNLNGISDIDFGEEDLIEAMGEFACNSAAGPDGFPAMMLNKCRTSLAYPLFLIWRKSVNEGIVSNSCKLGNIIPIHKGKSRAIAKNYRPVALTSLLVETFER